MWRPGGPLETQGLMEVLPLRWEATLVVFLEIGAGARSNRVGLGLVVGTLGFGFG